jgi:hypothetical protein
MQQKWVKNLKITGKKIKVVQEYFEGNYSREQILKYAKARSDGLGKKFKGRISVSLYFPDVCWRAGYFTDFGAPIETFDPTDYDMGEEPDHFTKVSFFMNKTAPRAGGCDGENNDCLYDVLKLVRLDQLPWKSQIEFKKWLGLKRKDKVDISHMAKIENKLNCKINVTGDHIYSSVSKAICEIKIKLLDGHYKFDTSGRKPIKGISYTEKKPLLYLSKTNPVQVYDGNYRTITKEEFKEIRNKPQDATFILVPADATTKKADNGDPETKIRVLKTSLKDQYDEFIKDANLLKQKSKFINLFKTGSDRSTALNLFDRFTKSITPDPIRQDEAQWLDNAMLGPIVNATKYKGPGYKYDVCSMYASEMVSGSNTYPFKRGEFEILTQTEFDATPNLKFGIYRCKVEGDINKYLFKVNKNNYYTSRDLLRARDLKYTLTLTEDGEANFLYYGRETRVTGKQYFGAYVDHMMPLKQSGIGKAKDILNILWGALCQKDEFKLFVSEEEPLYMGEDKTILSITPCDEDKVMIEVCRSDSMYETNHARMGPFLVANGRARISNIIEPYVDKVVRCHTDSMFVNEQIDVKTGTQLGELRYEGYCPNMEVKNMMKVIGEFN